MENIGQLLKERREELGYSISEMSAKIKISEDRLEAIEAGDLQYFKNELSYLSYYIRYYCKALYIDFDIVRENLDQSIIEYEHTVALSKTKIHEEMNQSIKAKVKEKELSTIQKNPNYRNLKVKGVKGRIDAGIAVFLVLAIVALFVLGYVFFNNILPNLNPPSSNTPPVVTTPEEGNNGSEDNPTQPPVDTLVLEVSKNGNADFTVSNYVSAQPFKVTVEFVSKSWFAATYTDETQKVFETKTYEKGSKNSMTITADKAQTLSLRFGYFKGSKIILNDQVLDISQDMSDVEVITFTINFKGANE